MHRLATIFMRAEPISSPLSTRSASRSIALPIDERRSLRWPICVFVAALILFLSYAIHTSKQLSYSTQLGNLADADKILLLHEWDVQASICDRSATSTCTAAGSWPGTKIYDATAIHQIMTAIHAELSSTGAATQAAAPNIKVMLSRTLTFKESLWIHNNPFTSLVIPAFVGTSARLVSPHMTQWLTATKSDHIFTLPTNTDVNTLTLEVVASPDQNWFSSFYPPALVNWNYVDEYANLDQIQQFIHLLQRTSLVLIPLITAALALILDHAKTVLYVSYIGLIMAARAVIANIFEAASPNLQAPLSWLWIALTALSPIFILLLACHLVKRTLPTRYFVAGAATSLLIQLMIFYYQPTYLRYADMWNDLIGSIAGFGVIALGMVFRTSSTDHQDTLIGKDTPGIILTGLIFAISSITMILDLTYTESAGTSHFTPWIHQLFVPALFIASLIHVGSVFNTIHRVSMIIKEKTRIDRDIEIGRQLQQGILPPKKFSNQSFGWHTFYYPASRLAGDWFDLQEVTTQQQRTLLLACIVDVTGHGISSAMMISNIASHWSIWIDSLRTMDLAEDPDERNAILATAPYQIHRGLVGLRYNLGCSMAVIMMEPQTGFLTYLTAGHPGIVLIHPDHTFRYLTSQGTRPGITNGDHAWEAHTIELPQLPKTLVMFTDGIVETRLTVPTWLQRIRRQSRTHHKSPTYYITSQLRTNRKIYRRDHHKEDDLSLLIIQLHGHKV